MKMNNTTHEVLLIASMIQSFCCIVFLPDFKIQVFNSHQFYMDKFFLISENSASLPDFSHPLIHCGIIVSIITVVLNPFIQHSLPFNKATSSYIMFIPLPLNIP